jgi:predicted 2-oxoglutarate/Fe(II)-dependent dioxygenase YbiX
MLAGYAQAFTASGPTALPPWCQHPVQRDFGVTPLSRPRNLAGALALAQSGVLSPSPWTARRAPMHIGQGTSQPIVSDFRDCRRRRNRIRPQRTASDCPPIVRIEHRSVGQLWKRPLYTNWCDWTTASGWLTVQHGDKRIAQMKHRTPALLLQKVFSEKLCKALVRGFDENGGTETGYAGLDGKMIVNHEIKFRRDWVIQDKALIGTLTEVLSERVLQPLFQATWFKTRSAEKFMIARYDIGGHFAPHVDISPQTAHRRFAVSLGLNNDYEGGELSFPDFQESFRLERGDAIVFSCGLQHGVKPVANGARYAFLMFLY